MKILITGCKGQLGTELLKQLTDGNSELGPIPSEYLGAEIVPVDIDNYNLASREDVFANIAGKGYDLVINCAAYTNVDGCEADEENAYLANAIGPRNLAEVCESEGIKLVHVSTDYVFPGDGSVPYTEKDTPNPATAYGRTKLAGERFVAEHCSKYFILRTAWLYGYNGKNFVKTILRVAKEKGKVNVVNDQTGNPTSAVDLAFVILKIALTCNYGIYHATCNGICSWYDFARTFLEMAEVDAEVIPCSSEEYPSKTPRPKYSALDNSMLRNTIGDPMRNWQDAVKEYIENLEQQK